MPKKPSQPWWKTVDSDAVTEASEEATTDCYGDEALGSLVEMAMQELEVPFKGKVLGQAVDVVDVVLASTSHHDVDFICELNGQRFAIAARSVDMPKTLPDGHLILAALFDYQSRSC